MRLLYCDESNLEYKSGRFFIYGGIMIKAEDAMPLCLRVRKIREEARLPDGYILKFRGNPKPLTPEHHNVLKGHIISAAKEHKVKTIWYLILHDCIIKDKEKEKTNVNQARRNGINTICCSFQRILEAEDDSGLVLIDRFNDEGNQGDEQIKRNAQEGLKFHWTGYNKELDRIIGLHYSAIEQSALTSICDIMIGSLRFSINAFTDGDQKLDMAKKLLKAIAPTIWRSGNSDSVPDEAFAFRPKTVRVKKYREQYQEIKQWLGENGLFIEELDRQ